MNGVIVAAEISSNENIGNALDLSTPLASPMPTAFSAIWDLLLVVKGLYEISPKKEKCIYHLPDRLDSLLVIIRIS